MEKRRVVITGMGTVNPIGNSVAESWQAVKDGKCGIGPITRYDCSDMRVKLAGEVKNLDIDSVLGKREAKKMDRFTQFALIAAQQAMDDSGLDREGEDLSRCGVICSSGIGGFETVSEAHRRGESRGYDSVSPFVIPMIISNMAAGQIAIRFGFQGMCTCVVTACAGGTNAVGDAFRHIRDGYGDVMLCGGTEAAITPLAMGGFTARTRTPPALLSPLTRSAAALSWVRAPECWCWRNMSTQRPGEPRSMPRWRATAPTATPTTSPPPPPGEPAVRPVWPRPWPMPG